MNSMIDEEIMENHNNAYAFLSLFFLGIDVIAYIILFTLFNCDFKNMTSPKQKLYYFVFLDGISRLINIYTDAYNKNFLQETTFSFIATIQFYLSLSILEQIFSDKNNDSFTESELKIRNKSLFSFLFFCFAFSFKGILPNHTMISLIQYVFILISISIFYKYLNNKINTFLSNIQKKHNQITSRYFISNLPFFIYIYFLINYVLQLFELKLDNKLYESYMSMICTIFKEVGKYLVIVLLVALYNTFNKYVKDTYFGYAPQNEVPLEKKEKKKVEVYKDEEETDNL